MIDSDVIIAKVDYIQRCLKRIKDVTELKPDKLENLDTQDIVVLNLQRGIQASIDLAAHIIAEEGWGVPRELREHFDLLHKNNLIDQELTTKLRNMVGFRNIAIHEYQKIDEEILKSIITTNLKDFEVFYRTILKHYDLI